MWKCVAFIIYPYYYRASCMWDTDMYFMQYAFSLDFSHFFHSAIGIWNIALELSMIACFSRLYSKPTSATDRHENAGAYRGLWIYFSFVDTSEWFRTVSKVLDFCISQENHLNNSYTEFFVQSCGWCQLNAIFISFDCSNVCHFKLRFRLTWKSMFTK